MEKIKFEITKEYLHSINKDINSIFINKDRELILKNIFKTDNYYFNILLNEYLDTILKSNHSIDFILSPTNIEIKDNIIRIKSDYSQTYIINLNIGWYISLYTKDNLVILSNKNVNGDTVHHQFIFDNNKSANKFVSEINHKISQTKSDIFIELIFNYKLLKPNGKSILDLINNIKLYPLTMDGKETYNIITGEKIIVLENKVPLETYKNSWEFGCRLFYHYIQDSIGLVESFFPDYKAINRNDLITDLIED